MGFNIIIYCLYSTQFNYETATSHTVNVCADDTNTVDATRQTCESLTVSVQDANDLSPVFNPTVYSGSVDENAANAYTVRFILF